MYVRRQSLALPGRWRVAFTGNLLRDQDPGRGDLKIEVYLGQVSDTEREPLLTDEIQGDLVRREMPVGEIPITPWNSILWDGVLLRSDEERLSFELSTERDIDYSTSAVRVISRLQKDDDGRYVVPVRKRWHEVAMDEKRHGLLLAFASASDPFHTIIPAYEIFRFFYATSSVIAGRYFDGSFLAPETELWDPEKTRLDGEGNATIWLRKKMSPADARFLARFAFCQFALERAKNIARHAMRSQAIRSMATLMSLPPFEGVVRTAFVGCPLTSGVTGRMLVTKLLSCACPPPFTALQWGQDGADTLREEVPAEDAEEIGEPRFIQRWLDSTLVSDMVDAPASLPHQPLLLTEEEISRRFPLIAAVPAEKIRIPRADGPSPPKSTWRVKVSSPIAMSVTDAYVRTGRVARAVIRAGCSHRDRSFIADPQHCESVYLRILNLLKEGVSRGFIKAEFLTVFEDQSIVQGVPFNVYPVPDNTFARQWSYIDYSSGARRMVLVVKLVKNDRIRYVAELQQKVYGECSTIVLWNQGENEIETDALNELLLQCASWGKARFSDEKRFGIQSGRIIHGSGDWGAGNARHFIGAVFEVEARRRRK